jgi:hypothetical protein
MELDTETPSFIPYRAALRQGRILVASLKGNKTKGKPSLFS